MIARTLFAHAGVEPKPASLSQAVLIVIDAQEEYGSGRLPLAGIDAAADELARLLAAARAAGAPIVHVVHQGRPGGLFDPDGPGGAILAAAAPLPGEAVARKTLPNSFTSAAFREALDATGRKSLVLAGFMTHMCVSATARSALDHGFSGTIVAAATATRDLPGPDGSVVPAAVVQQASLAALGDRFAAIVRRAADLPA